MKPKILFICPHWHQDGNVGVIRAKRMVRWMVKVGYEVVILAAGSTTYSCTTDFGKVFTVQDPLGVFTDKKSQEKQGSKSTLSRKPNYLRRMLAYALFTPDLQIVWALYCYLNTDVRKICEESALVLSTSPPESAHVLAGWLSRWSRTPFIMDMRDGWLDEPMKPLLRLSKAQRMRETRLESRLLRQAAAVLVTSSVWKEKLIERYPSVGEKILVHTNGYPHSEQKEVRANLNRYDGDHSGNVTPPVEYPNKPVLRILHAGRVQSSRPERKIDEVLNPVYSLLHRLNINCELTFLGNLEPDEEAELINWLPRLRSVNSKLVRIPQVPHSDVPFYIENSDLLLLTSPSKASIPAKFFDYLWSGKPILCFTNIDSAVHRAITRIPQCHFCDISKPDMDALNRFVNDVLVRSLEVEIPDYYGEDALKDSFLAILKEVSNK
ncbi:MAG: hypothetical protein JJU41_07015 [Bacteroidetes bacterium]|nr:hypothetical protein [Bacteroidota bacterium]MCH8523460.1 hypothetical protein [Balneolales bacterium]